MPAHDWSRLSDEAFHSTDTAWISLLCRRLNSGLLPNGYSAYGERFYAGSNPDVSAYTTFTGDMPAVAGELVLATEPVKSTAVAVQEEATSVYQRKQQQLAIRTSDSKELVAVLEIVSQGNKSSSKRLEQFLRKTTGLVMDGINVGIVDLYACGNLDSEGLLTMAWREVTGHEPAEPLPSRESAQSGRCVASWKSSPVNQLYADEIKPGQPIPELPLSLRPDAYVRLPLEETYIEALESLPREERFQLEAGN